MIISMRQTSKAMGATMDARRIRSQATARASGPVTPEPLPTFDGLPTQVPPVFTPIADGFLFAHQLYPSKNPVVNSGWSYNLPEGKRVVVYAGGLVLASDADRRAAGDPDMTELRPPRGVLMIHIRVPRPDPRDPELFDKEDPRGGSVTLPVQDGMARVVDARVSAGRLLVFVRTEGGSTYTYEVNSHTLTQTGGPTATPLPSAAPAAEAP